jgi:hypothetical protein
MPSGGAVMSREADYLVFAAEQYRFAKGLTGAEVAALFEKYGVSKFIMDSFELFHIESEQNMIAAVDDFIERKKSAAKI